MMNRIILIGNGFDLAHGLKTSYNDFILDLIRNKIKQAKDDGYKNKVLQSSTKRGYFYDDLLLEIYFLNFNNIDNFFNNINSFETVNEIIEYFNLQNCELKIKSSIIAHYLEKWADFEKSYFHNLIIANKKNNDEVLKINAEFQLILEYLIEYIKKNQLEIPHANLNTNKIEELIAWMTNENIQDYLFLNFNYTNTLDFYLNRFKSNKKASIINIHGNVNNFNHTDEIILGFDNNMHPEFNELLKSESLETVNYMKSHLYSLSRNKTNLTNIINSNIYDVITLGHSLDVSDNSILKEIFEHQNCVSIQIFYNPHDSNDFKSKSKLLRKMLLNPKDFGKIIPRSESSPMPILLNNLL